MIYAFLPFLSAALYGLGYVLLDKLLKNIPILVFMSVSSVAMSVAILATAYFKLSPQDFSFIHDKKIVIIFIATVFFNIIAWITTLLALQNTNATYVSFAEISYPVFTVLFLYLLFGEHQLNWQSLVGGMLILAGSGFLVYSKMTGVKP
jgi:drug/metabolite transporter (DMT)-like permease